jgi:hypothetical protein
VLETVAGKTIRRGLLLSKRILVQAIPFEIFLWEAAMLEKVLLENILLKIGVPKILLEIIPREIRLLDRMPSRDRFRRCWRMVGGRA